MRVLFCAIAMIAMLAATGFSGIASGFGYGSGGVMDGSKWKTPTGSHKISVTASGNTLGWYDVEVKEGDTTGSTSEGVGHEDGGVDSTPKIDVGDQDYRAQGGKMQWKNGAGSWVDMIKDCSPPKSKDPHATGHANFTYDGGFISPGACAADDEMVGTLP